MSGSRCARCAAPVDPLRSPAIVDGGHVVNVCAACRSGDTLRPREPQFLPQYEPWRRCRCGRAIAPGSAITTVVETVVELRCGRCNEPRAAVAPLPPPAPPALSSRRSPARRKRALVAAAVLCVAAIALALPGSSRTAAIPALTVVSSVELRDGSGSRAPAESPNLAPVEPMEVAAPDVPPPSAGAAPDKLRATPSLAGETPEPPGEAESDVAEIDDIELGPPEDGHDTVDVIEHASLADWTHPVPGTSDLIPTAPSRNFGASRPGSRPSECGGGHCGVDLAGPRGAPIVAVKAGVVVWIERRSDRRSGRYVRVRHSGGVVTWYMHLDSIAEELEVGTPVKAGQRLGTLGATGIHSSEPHLHFSVQGPPAGKRGRYLDPSPMLEAAQVIDPLDVVQPRSDFDL